MAPAMNLFAPAPVSGKRRRKSLRPQQHGGTLLGIVLGALVGLGAALAVAVYVTKVPVPFMIKSQPRNPDGDAVEAQRNKDWNPNAPLAGKSPPIKPAAAAASVVGGSSPDTIGLPDAPAAVPVATASAASAPSAPSAAAAAVIAKANAAAAAAAAQEAAAAKKLATDPLGDLAAARVRPPVEATALPPITGSDPFNYFIQAGAFRTVEDAEQQRARLLLLGVQAKVTEREQSGRTVYRVRLGPFDKKEEADKVKERLDNNSIETALVRVQR